MTGAVVTHRIVEGSLLGLLVVTSGELSPVVAVVLGDHAIGEMLIVGQVYLDATAPVRGAVAVVLTQFVAASVASVAVVGWIPESVASLVLSTAGGVLVLFGLHEFVTHCLPSRKHVLRSG